MRLASLTLSGFLGWHPECAITANDLTEEDAANTPVAEDGSVARTPPLLVVLRGHEWRLVRLVDAELSYVLAPAVVTRQA